MANIDAGGGGGSSDPSAPAIDYHVMSLGQLQAALTTSSKTIYAAKQAWQQFAANLYNQVAASGSTAKSLDNAISGLQNGWSGPASDHFMTRVKAVRDFATELVAAASIEACPTASATDGDFGKATSMIGDSIDRMNQACKDFTNSVRACLQDFMNSLLGNKYTIGTLSTSPTGRIFGPSGGLQQQEYHFTYTADGLLDAIKLTGTVVPWIGSYGGRGTPPIVHDGTAIITTSVDPGIRNPGQTPSLTAQVTLNPNTDTNWAFNTFQHVVLWHQLALLLNYTAPIAYQMPARTFPSPPKSPGLSSNGNSQSTPGSSGSNGHESGFGGGGGAGLGAGGGGLPFGGGAGLGAGGGGLPFGGGAAGGGIGGPAGGGLGSGGNGSGGAGGAGPAPPVGGNPPTNLPTKLAGLGSGGAPGMGGSFGGGLGPGGAGSGLGGLGGGAGPGGGAGLGGGAGPAGGPGGTGAGALTGAATAGREMMPMMPPMMPMGGAGQTDDTRQRKSWLPEEEDIWGVGGEAIPPVISSDT